MGNRLDLHDEDTELTLGSYCKMPAPQTEMENCTAHNGSIIPIPGRDIEWRSLIAELAMSIMDFTIQRFGALHQCVRVDIWPPRLHFDVAIQIR